MYKVIILDSIGGKLLEATFHMDHFVTMSRRGWIKEVRHGNVFVLEMSYSHFEEFLKEAA